MLLGVILDQLNLVNDLTSFTVYSLINIISMRTHLSRAGPSLQIVTPNFYTNFTSL
jgi:hypothetical protein